MVGEEANGEEVTIGLGGGGARKGRKKRTGRNGKQEDAVPEAEDTGGYPAPPFDIPADP